MIGRSKTMEKCAPSSTLLSSLQMVFPLVILITNAAILVDSAFLTGPSTIKTTRTTATIAFLPDGATVQTRSQSKERERAFARIIRHYGTSGDSDDEVDENNNEGASLAAELFKMAQQKGIDINNLDLEDEDTDDEEEDDEDDEDEVNIPQGAIDAFMDKVSEDVDEKLVTNDQLYSEMKERVLDTAGGFVEFVGKGIDAEDDDDEDGGEAEAKKVYSPPSTVPDSDLTAGEVILTILNALRHNDVPTENKGVEILFGYSSEGSQIRNDAELTVEEYAGFLMDSEYKVLFDHQDAVIDKADYGYEGKKAFFTARLKTGPGARDSTSVNFILSNKNGKTDDIFIGSKKDDEDEDDDSCWLIDSMLIRPQSMRRRRRK